LSRSATTENPETFNEKNSLSKRSMESNSAVKIIGKQKEELTTPYK